MVIEAEGQKIWEACGEFERALKIKRIRKTITLVEELVFVPRHPERHAGRPVHALDAGAETLDQLRRESLDLP